MKIYLFTNNTIWTSLLVIAAFFLPSFWGEGAALFAQQAQQEKRSDSQLVFPTFQNAMVRQSFGRVTRGKCNIMYKNAALCFLDETDGKIRQAFVQNILGVDFDSCRYIKVDSLAMGLLVGEQNGHQLLRVTTIDMDRYKELTTGGTDMPFFDLDMAGFGPDTFVDLSGSEQASNVGYPLKDRWVFRLKSGTFVPATQRNIKKHVKREYITAFKNLMDDRWWSWKDEESLKKLFMFLE